MLMYYGNNQMLFIVPLACYWVSFQEFMLRFIRLVMFIFILKTVRQIDNYNKMNTHMFHNNGGVQFETIRQIDSHTKRIHTSHNIIVWLLHCGYGGLIAECYLPQAPRLLMAFRFVLIISQQIFALIFCFYFFFFKIYNTRTLVRLESIIHDLSFKKTVP